MKSEQLFPILVGLGALVVGYVFGVIILYVIVISAFAYVVNAPQSESLTQDSGEPGGQRTEEESSQEAQQVEGESAREGRERSRSECRAGGTSRLRPSYAVLGLSPGASQEEIEAAFRKLSRQYHPDKVSHLGQEFVEMAHEKFREIQEAYETLTRCSV